MKKALLLLPLLLLGGLVACEEDTSSASSEESLSSSSSSSSSTSLETPDYLSLFKQEHTYYAGSVQIQLIKDNVSYYTSSIRYDYDEEDGITYVSVYKTRIGSLENGETVTYTSTDTVYRTSTATYTLTGGSTYSVKEEANQIGKFVLPLDFNSANVTITSASPYSGSADISVDANKTADFLMSDTSISIEGFSGYVSMTNTGFVNSLNMTGTYSGCDLTFSFSLLDLPTNLTLPVI